MIGWVNGDLSQRTVDRLMVWRSTCWRWYLAVPPTALFERPEVVNFLADGEVWLWTDDPPTLDQAVVANQWGLAGWVWQEPHPLPWEPMAARLLGYDIRMQFRVYVDMAGGIPGGTAAWLDYVTHYPVARLIPWWSRPPDDWDPGLYTRPTVDCPERLLEAVGGGSPVRCGRVSCLALYPDRVIGCQWSGSSGTLALPKAEALGVVLGDVARCGGCLTPFPYWDTEHLEVAK